MTHFKGQFAVEGTERMMTQMLSGDALSDRMDDHRLIAAAGIPVHFAYAEDDPEIPVAQVSALRFMTMPTRMNSPAGIFSLMVAPGTGRALYRLSKNSRLKTRG